MLNQSTWLHTSHHITTTTLLFFSSNRTNNNINYTIQGTTICYGMIICAKTSKIAASWISISNQNENTSYTKSAKQITQVWRLAQTELWTDNHKHIPLTVQNNWLWFRVERHINNENVTLCIIQVTGSISKLKCAYHSATQLAVIICQFW